MPVGPAIFEDDAYLVAVPAFLVEQHLELVGQCACFLAFDFRLAP